MRITSFITLVAPFFGYPESINAAVYPFDVTTLSSPDGSITAKFVSFGATMTELWVRDRVGDARDIILGYDDNSKLLTDPAHPVFNAIVGRYANRIKNGEELQLLRALQTSESLLYSGTFSIPITKLPQPPGPNVYHIPTNDHDGQDTLHGGIFGWDRRNWTIVQKSRTSVTYKHVDMADEGFPGNITAFATHSVSNGGVLKTTVHATATQKTPLMLTQHIYWNLDAFQDNTTNTLNHHLRVDASKVVQVDGDAIPTGEFISAPGTPFDFKTEQEIGARLNTTGFQGYYDNCWIYDSEIGPLSSSRTSLWSDLSGIRLDIFTNQPAVQVYTAFLDTPRKFVHGGPSLNYSLFSAVAIEQEGYIDAINTPEWNVDQIYYPGKEYEWSTTYRFSVRP